MALPDIKADKWKIVSLILIGIFAVMLFSSFSTHQRQVVELSDEEKAFAVDLATEALEGRITDDFTPSIRGGHKFEAEAGEQLLMAGVQFTSETDDKSYLVMVDLTGGEVVSIIENMKGIKELRGPPPKGFPFIFRIG